jgi:hypothetical protein
MRDWASKAHGQVARLAAVLHMAEHHDQDAPWKIEISLETTEAALEQGDYFLEHARAAFALMGEDPNLARALKLARWIQHKQIEQTTKRELHRALPTVFARADQLDRPLEILEDRGYVRVVRPRPRLGPGRAPSPTVIFNPKWLRQFRHIRQNCPADHSGGLSVKSVKGVEGAKTTGPEAEPRGGHGKVRL